MAQDDTVSFGYTQVPRAQKQRLVRGVFDSVAGRYDLMNDLMSGGLHRVWKDALVAALDPRPGLHVLDVAGGTGDIAFRMADAMAGHGRVTVCDINASMVSVGRDRALDRGWANGIDWIVGNAEALPVPDASVDIWTCAFGVRNMTDIPKVLAEAYRVLRPGGRFACLEFSKVRAPLLARAYDAYSFSVLPRLGGRVAGDREAYRYLAESIRKFPDQDTYARMIAEAGFGVVKCRNLTGGIVALHTAWRV